MKRPKALQSGQSLVLILVFMAITVMIVSGAVAVSVVNFQTTGKVALSEVARGYAQSGAEEAVLQIIRNPSYTVTNKSILMGSGNVTLTVSGTSTNKTIVSTGTESTFQRKIQVIGGYVNNAFVISSWQEIN